MRSRAHIKSHPLHPMLVAFPIGLWVTSFAFDLFAAYHPLPGLSGAAWYCMLAGCVGAAVAVVPGVIDLFSVVPKGSSARGRGYRHAILNVLALLLFVANLAYRGTPSSVADGPSFVMSGIGVLILGVSGWMGATLVYRNQIGVEHLHANATPLLKVERSSWAHSICRETDLHEGQIMLAEIQGAHVAIARCASGLVAFSDACSHKGGSLSDGALVGCTVQCPWHGSQFDVTTGRVLAGPAEKTIEIYDVDIRKGEVFVFPKRGRESREERAA